MERRDNLEEIVISESQALEQRSVSLARRGLRALSGWDVTNIIVAAKEITSADSVDQVLRILKEKIEELFHPPSLALLLVEEYDTARRSDRLYYATVTGNNCEALRQEKVLIGQGLAGHVAKVRNSVVIADLRNDVRFSTPFEHFPEKEVRSVVAVPLHVSNKPIGVIELFNCFGPSEFPEGDLHLLESLADFAAIAIENHGRLNRALAIAEDSDPIDQRTGLYTKSTAGSRMEWEMMHLERASGDGSAMYQFSWIAIGIEGLKSLADSMNYRLFDRLLTEIGQELWSWCRTPDIAAAAGRRLSGAGHSTKARNFAFRSEEDQFGLFLMETTKQDACVVARRLHRVLNETVWLQETGLNVPLRAKVALATYPVDAASVRGLMTNLEAALRLLPVGGCQVDVGPACP